DKADPYAKYYGQSADISSTLSLRFDKYYERTNSDGTKIVTLTFRVTNSGTEESSTTKALFISDENNRNFEANPWVCQTIVNPGLSKDIDCSFYDIPIDSKIVALKLGDSIGNKGKYTTLMTFGS
ncbi:MAG TPA: hypothetical protein PLO51_05760, partial [Candidatus Micrarchaeota archaeon]|nr:hypothetical protein [Candidatus Micrarchaeota archaeon]